MFSRRPVVVLSAMLLAIVVAPKVMLLMPVWLAGVLTYRLISRHPPPSPALAWFLAIAPPLAYVLCLASGVPHVLLGLSVMLLGKDAVGALGFSDEFVWNGLIALFVSLHFIGVAAVVRSGAVTDAAWHRAIRWLAGGTFSLYLVHYPALQLFDAALPAMTPALRYAVLLALVIATAYLFAAAFERPLRAERAFLRRLASKAAPWLSVSRPDPRRFDRIPSRPDGPRPATAAPR
jgi:peptidoglycan/LPS O-acetylase OafA/YrhL